MFVCREAAAGGTDSVTNNIRYLRVGLVAQGARPTGHHRQRTGSEPSLDRQTTAGGAEEPEEADDEADAKPSCYQALAQ